MIGSANMDRRSFELNYENNILFYDAALTGVMRERQQDYIARSQPCHEGGGGGLADVAPAVEQPHRHARARALTFFEDGPGHGLRRCKHVAGA